MKAISHKVSENHKRQIGTNSHHSTEKPPASSLFRSDVNLSIQHKLSCPCGGGCPRCRGVIQPKLIINQPGDIYEQEADRVAEQVTAASAHPSTRSEPPQIQRLAGSSAEQADSAPDNVDQVLASPGMPLEPALRQDMEQRLEHDFSQVRVHSGAAAEQSARDVNANAYTVGHNIVFGAGQFAPETRRGMGLLAHELTHIIQQQADGSAKLQRQVKDPRQLQVVSTEAARRVKVAEYLRETTTGGGTIKEAIYWIDFEVDKQGVVRASVRTVTPDRLYRSANLRFGDEFRRALEHFKASGVEVTAFEGDWSYMSKGEISENLRVFKESLEQGWTRERAARSTPTGRVAAASGFEVASVENVLESQPHLAEESVRRWRVKAIFRRPPLAPMTPPATTVSGEITGTQHGPVTPPGKGTVPIEIPQGGMPKLQSPIESPFPGSGMPEPVLEPEPSFRSAVASGAKAGLKEAFSAGNIAAIAIPEVILRFSDIAAARDAIRRIETKFAKEGFAKGVAAGVAEWSEEQVASNLKNRVIPFQVRGLEDPGGLLGYSFILQLAEAYENYAVDLGYQFSSSKTLKWKGDMLAKGLAVLAKRGYHFGEEQSSAPAVKRVYLGNVIVEEELDPAESGPEPKPRYLFEYGFIDKLAWVLRPITNPIIEKAIEKGDESRRAQQEAELKKMKRESGAVGMKF